jgi:hypothetical protein
MQEPIQKITKGIKDAAQVVGREPSRQEARSSNQVSPKQTNMYNKIKIKFIYFRQKISGGGVLTIH